MTRKENYFKRLWNWRRRAAGGLPSTGTTGGNSVSPRPKMQQGSPSSNMYHQSCQTLRYDKWIEIVLTGDLSHLIISGTPTGDELESAWKSILTEYSELVQTEKSEDVFAAYKKVVQTEWHISFIDHCIAVLKVQYDKEIADLLSARGFGEVVYSEDREVYLKSLYGIQMEAKVLVVLLNQYTAEYKSLAKDDISQQEPGAARTRADYEKELWILSKFQGYRIIPAEITVLQYCMIVNLYIDEYRRKKSEADRVKNKY